VGLPAIWVLTAVSVGGSLFGISGMLFFIPLTSSCYALLRESVNDRNARRRMPGAVGKENGKEDRSVVEMKKEEKAAEIIVREVEKAPERRPGGRKNGKRP
jgi:hypothetical protein